MNERQEPKTNGKSDQERLVMWNSIDNVPAFEWVWLYSPEYHKTAGREKKGVMQGCFKPETKTLAAEFVDDFGIAIKWEFTKWMSIPDAT